MASPSKSPLQARGHVPYCDPHPKLGSVLDRTASLHVARREAEAGVPIPLAHGRGAGQWQGRKQKPGLPHPARMPLPALSSFLLCLEKQKKECQALTLSHWIFKESQGHTETETKGKKPIFTASRRCAACLSRLLAPHHNRDKMLFSFQWCAQVPIQMRIIHTLLSKHCEVFKG